MLLTSTNKIQFETNTGDLGNITNIELPTGYNALAATYPEGGTLVIEQLYTD